MHGACIQSESAEWVGWPVKGQLFRVEFLGPSDASHLSPPGPCHNLASPRTQSTRFLLRSGPGREVSRCRKKGTFPQTGPSSPSPGSLRCPRRRCVWVTGCDWSLCRRAGTSFPTSFLFHLCVIASPNPLLTGPRPGFLRC